MLVEQLELNIREYIEHLNNGMHNHSALASRIFVELPDIKCESMVDDQRNTYLLIFRDDIAEDIRDQICEYNAESEDIYIDDPKHIIIGETLPSVMLDNRWLVIQTNIIQNDNWWQRASDIEWTFNNAGLVQAAAYNQDAKFEIIWMYFKQPNEVTLEAMREVESGFGLEQFDSHTDAFKSLDI